MARIDFTEYTRLRDIVQKRQKRLVQAGKMEPVHFPTVREIKSGWVDPGAALNAIKDFYSGGSTLKAVKQTGLVPTVPAFQEQPKPRPLTSAEKRERKRRSDRLYRQRERIKNTSETPEIAAQRSKYLKALQTLQKKGFNIGGLDLGSMTPKQAQDFVEYMEYRFSQGDFNQVYVIDKFVKQYSELQKQGYSTEKLKADFDKFMEDRTALEGKRDSMEGITESQLNNYWDLFIDDEDDLPF